MRKVATTGSGYCLYYKRLEQGTFAFPSLGEGVMSLSGAQLSLLLEGIDWHRLVARSLPTPQVAA